jgi:hypothetical protein
MLELDTPPRGNPERIKMGYDNELQNELEGPYYQAATTQPAPDTGEWLSQLQVRIDSRDDSNAMNSACGEYNCPCHYDLPKLLHVTATARDTLLLVQRLLVNQQACEQSLCASCNEARQTILDSVDAALTTLRRGA